MPVQTPSPQVLLVEDDTDLGEVIQTFLSEEGYTVHLAPTLADALALADTHAFSLALTDLLDHSHAHPLVAALPLLERLQPTPVGILTGWPLADELAQAQGFAFLLRKPFDMDDLLAIVAVHTCCRQLPEQAQPAPTTHTTYPPA